jgi:hypothetical protein
VAAALFASRQDCAGLGTTSGTDVEDEGSAMIWIGSLGVFVHFLSSGGDQQPIETDTDFEHPPTASGDCRATIFCEVLLPHDQIENGRQYPALTEIHGRPCSLSSSPQPGLLH